MNMTDLKQILNSAGFSQTTLEGINQILEKGSLTEEDKKSLLKLVDNEIETRKIEAQFHEDMAIALESLVQEVDTAATIAEENLKNLETP